MASENPKHVVTSEVRLSYVHILQPYANRNNPGEEKYSVTVLVPKGDVATKQRIDAAIEAAKQDGVKLWGGRPPMIPTPVYDGDGTRPSDGAAFGPEAKGCWVFTASCKKDRPPRVVDENVQDIIDPHRVYSGVYGRVGIDFYPYFQAGKKGIGCGLTNIQILRDGEPLDNRRSAEDDFGTPAPAPTYNPPQQQPFNPYAYGAAVGAPDPSAYQHPAQGYTGAVDPITGMPIR